MELAFGCGQYVCVGKAIAMVEAGKVLGEVSFVLSYVLFLFSFFGLHLTFANLGQLVRRYNWSLAKPLDPPKVTNNGVWAIRNFWVRVEKREGFPTA